MKPSHPPILRKDPIKITGLTRIARGLRRWWSSVEWAVTWLGLPRQRETAIEPGLILLQIDGLSLKVLQEALEQQEMPFVRSLTNSIEYRVGPCYSGLPSNWAAAQAELLYGARGVIPGSRYYDRTTKQVVHIIEPAAARVCEEKLATRQPGLLAGGSSYCNLLGGGATDVHFCGTSSGWGDSFRSLHPVKILSTALLHLGMWLRGAIQVGREIFDLGFAPDPRPELTLWERIKEIPSRVVATVFLRELSTLGACYDAARGTRIIQVNFLGYDEQSHRFGPESRRARRQLRAIDRSLRRIWRAAHLGSGREYDIWIFSTHGQEATTGSKATLCKELAAEVQRISERLILQRNESLEAPLHVELRLSESPPSPRSSWFGLTRWWQARTWRRAVQVQDPKPEPDILLVPSGTMAHVYLLTPRALALRCELSRELSCSPLAPIVFGQGSLADADQAARVQMWLDGQQKSWPENAVHVFGAKHEHLGYLAEDLSTIADQPNSGDLVICGWSGAAETLNYLGQAGGHNGPGIDESTGFTLLPSDVHATLSSAVAPRPTDLRVAAEKVLGSLPLLRQTNSSASRNDEATQMGPLRIVTYNIHGGVGMDGELTPSRIARVIGQCQADIVCLQEVDRLRPRSKSVDQLQVIADALGMNFAFAPAWEDGRQAFGNAILTAIPFEVVKSGLLQRQKATRNARSVLWIELQIAANSIVDAKPAPATTNTNSNANAKLQVINTHLSIYPTEQVRQAEELVREWLEPAQTRGPVVLCGDFNAAPNSSTWSAVSHCLRDVEHGQAGKPHPTYFSPYPILRVDHIFVSPNIVPTSQVVRSRLAKIASDHLPVMADLKFEV